MYQIKFGVIWTYISAGGVKLLYVCMMCHILYVVAQVLTNIWLSQWSTDPVINGTVDQAQVDLRLGVYGGLVGIQGWYIPDIYAIVCKKIKFIKINLYSKL